MVLGPFAERKGPRLPGRNPATQKITLTQEPAKKTAKFPANVFFLEIINLDFLKYKV